MKNHQTTTQAPKPKPKRKLMGRFEWLFLILSLGIILVLFLKSKGIHIVERTEEVEILDKPRSSSTPHSKRVAPSSKKKESVEVDNMLRHLAEQFSNQQSVNISTTAQNDQNLQWEISKDEANFYNIIREKNKLNSTLESTKDWLTLLSTSHRTYSKVKSLYDGLVADTGLSDSDFKTILQDETSARNFYSEMESMFNISEHDIHEFAQTGKTAISDWAGFVEEKKK